MNIIKQTRDKQRHTVEFNAFTFSGGEEHVRLTDIATDDITSITIQTNLTSSAAIMQLFMAVDAAKRLYGDKPDYHLVIPYFPYARQDRVCVEGEALAAKVMADLINNMGFTDVTIWDAHSDVTPALIDRVRNLPQTHIIEHAPKLSEAITTGAVTLVAPDAGAAKKTINVAKHFNAAVPPVQAEKVRDVATGAILSTSVNGDISGKDVLIVDDICDGGRTFIELAKALKHQGASTISLYVTHGIFSKGLDVFKDLIDTIYTTDSFNCTERFTQSAATTKLVVINV